MVGREAYHRPYLLAELHAALYPQDAWSVPTADQVLDRMAHYAAAEVAGGERLANITRHMLGLVSHTAGARDYRAPDGRGCTQQDCGTGAAAACPRTAAGVRW